MGTAFVVTDMGFLLPVDVGILIDAVVISPNASSEFDRDARPHLDLCGLTSTPGEKSSMAGVPIY
jgi:hypothetical protein